MRDARNIGRSDATAASGRSELRPRKPWTYLALRRILLLAAAALLSVLWFAGPVAAGPPVGGCPTGTSWEPVFPQHQPQAADLNGDGWLCRLFVGPDGQFTFFDNVVRER